MPACCCCGGRRGGRRRCCSGSDRRGALAARPSEAMKAGGAGSVSPGTRGSGDAQRADGRRDRDRPRSAHGRWPDDEERVAASGHRARLHPTGLIRSRRAPGSEIRLAAGDAVLRAIARAACAGRWRPSAYGNCPPVSGACNGTTASFPIVRRRRRNRSAVGVIWASPVLRTLGVRLVRGRCSRNTTGSAAESRHRQRDRRAHVLDDEDPIGKRIAVGQGGSGTAR